MINVLKPGVLTTVQDLGRSGYQKDGFVVGGAMDPFSFRVANLLVGNRENEATLEMTLQGATLSIEEDMIIAITGGDLSPRIKDEPLPLWRPIYVKKGNVIEWGACKSGCRAYLAVLGGLKVPDVMGSKSTYLRAGIGGWKGRHLKEGDRLPTIRLSQLTEDTLFPDFNKTLSSFSTVPWQADPHSIYSPEKIKTIRILPGTHQSQFSEKSLHALYNEEFKVSPQSDRMGYRLQGPKLERSEKQEILSEAVALGTVQVPASGSPVILLADRQTTGGYPRIGQVILPDIPLVAQMKPGESLRFQEVTWEEAEWLYFQAEKNINTMKNGISYKWTK